MRTGIFAALFYPFLVGALWRSRGPESLPLFLLGQIGKSLWITWFVFAVAFTLKLPDPLLPLVALVCLALVVRLRSSDPGVEVDRSTYGMLAIAFCIAMALLSVELALGGFGGTYRPIFQTNDALQSWNRWAIELAEKQYHPYNAAYPILWPALWSLIYRAQNTTDVWVLAKGTLLILPILLALSIMLLIDTRRMLAAVFLVSFCSIFFWAQYPFYMFNGDMDIPVCVLVVVCGVLVLAAVSAETEDNAGQAVQLTYAAAVFAGLASITKQPGTVMLIPVFTLIGILFFKKKMQQKEVASAIALALVPIIVFLAIFFAAGQKNPIGTLAQLQNYSAAPAAPATLDMLRAMLPFPVMAVTLTLALLNLFNVRRIEGMMGVIFLVLGVLGALAFGTCCSYDQRNGWWVICLFAVSALFGLSTFEHVVRPAKALISAVAPARILASLLVIALIVAIVSPQNLRRLARIQNEWQWKNMPAGAVYMLKTRLPLLGETGKVITADNFVRWLPGYRNRVVSCDDARCVRLEIGKHPNSMVMIRPSNPALVYREMSDLLKPEFLQGSVDDYEMYGPFPSN